MGHDLDDQELEATRKLPCNQMNARKYITRKDYILTNLSIDGCYCIRIKEGDEEKEYDVYYHGKDKYIKKGDEKIYLDDEVKKIYKSEVRIYERDGI